MQTLNVGAGRTDQEYQAAEESRRTELRNDVQTYGMYFFIAAGLAGLGTGLLPIRLFGVVNIGSIDLLTFYGGDLVRTYPLLLRAAAAAWVLVLIGLGFAARKGHRWAFWAGLVLYGADMLPLIAMFSIWAFGVHGFFLFQWFKGQKAWESSMPPLLLAKTSAVRRLAISSNLQVWLIGYCSKLILPFLISVIRVNQWWAFDFSYSRSSV